ncbi:hypothetical protein HK101_000970 [Irineochytrium annulatum]|nr:hypothetical protein HK101_000970 [Irineochytrium annulatum]
MPTKKRKATLKGNAHSADGRVEEDTPALNAEDDASKDGEPEPEPETDGPRRRSQRLQNQVELAPVAASLKSKASPSSKTKGKGGSRKRPASPNGSQSADKRAKDAGKEYGGDSPRDEEGRDKADGDARREENERAEVDVDATKQDAKDKRWKHSPSPPPQGVELDDPMHHASAFKVDVTQPSGTDGSTDDEDVASNNPEIIEPSPASSPYKSVMAGFRPSPSPPNPAMLTGTGTVPLRNSVDGNLAPSNISINGSLAPSPETTFISHSPPQTSVLLPGTNSASVNVVNQNLPGSYLPSPSTMNSSLPPMNPTIMYAAYQPSPENENQYPSPALAHANPLSHPQLQEQQHQPQPHQASYNTSLYRSMNPTDFATNSQPSVPVDVTTPAQTPPTTFHPYDPTKPYTFSASTTQAPHPQLQQPQQFQQYVYPPQQQTYAQHYAPAPQHQQQPFPYDTSAMPQQWVATTTAGPYQPQQPYQAQQVQSSHQQHQHPSVAVSNLYRPTDNNPSYYQPPHPSPQPTPPHPDQPSHPSGVPYVPCVRAIPDPATGEFRCDYPGCPKSYANPASFRNHQRTHLLVRKHPCTMCGKRFLRAQDLDRHGATHLQPEDYPFRCKCGVKFKRRDAVARHLKLQQCSAGVEHAAASGAARHQRQHFANNLPPMPEIHLPMPETSTPQGAIAAAAWHAKTLNSMQMHVRELQEFDYEQQEKMRKQQQQQQQVYEQ